jgi:hypothetical protein
MWRKNGFDRFPKFKSKGIKFEVGDKYLFRQLTGLLIYQSCQACSSKPLARYYNKRQVERPSQRFEDLKKSSIDQVEEIEDPRFNPNM